MRRQPARLVFLDDTSVTTNKTPSRGRGLRGKRLMADAPFGKLKTLLRKAKARTYDALWRDVGEICTLFHSQECWNYLKDAGYVAD